MFLVLKEMYLNCLNMLHQLILLIPYILKSVIKCVGCKINGKAQPLKTILNNGDQVEIITSHHATPSPLWERIAVTSKVKSQLRKFMRSKKKNEHIDFGREILKNLFEREELEYSDIAIEKVINHFNCKNNDNLFELVGSGSITAFCCIKKNIS